ncbi:MAG: hypothetical protein AAFQ19_16025 [Pseudomonadota bacterium]
MSKQPTSFEERLARIEKSRGGPAAPPPTAPKAPKAPTGPRPPRKGGGGTGMMIAGFVGIFVLATAVIGGATFLMSQQDAYIGIAERATEDEIAGKTTLATLLVSNDAAARSAFSLSVGHAKAKLASGALSAGEAGKHASFLKTYDGKSPADLMRGSMVSLLAMKATQAGQPELAQQVTADLNACRSTTCMAMVEAKFHGKLAALTGNR